MAWTVESIEERARAEVRAEAWAAAWAEVRPQVAAAEARAQAAEARAQAEAEARAQAEAVAARAEAVARADAATREAAKALMAAFEQRIGSLPAEVREGIATANLVALFRESIDPLLATRVGGQSDTGTQAAGAEEQPVTPPNGA